MEGGKSVTELLDSDYLVTHLLYTEKFAGEHPDYLRDFKGESYEVTANALEAAGLFQSNDSALAVARFKSNEPFVAGEDEWVLGLDDVRDPGNLGTIIRIADWYGIKKIAMSQETADLYNPKVLQSSMGSFTRMRFFYTDLALFLQESKSPVYGAFLDGESLYGVDFPSAGILVMGNESNGISDQISRFIQHRVTIPKIGNAESLNVAVATAIICDNIARLSARSKS